MQCVEHIFITKEKLTPGKKKKDKGKQAKTNKVKFYPPCFVTYISPRHNLPKAIIFIKIPDKTCLATCETTPIAWKVLM